MNASDESSWLVVERVLVQAGVKLRVLESLQTAVGRLIVRFLRDGQMADTVPLGAIVLDSELGGTLWPTGVSMEAIDELAGVELLGDMACSKAVSVFEWLVSRFH